MSGLSLCMVRILHWELLPETITDVNHTALELAEIYGLTDWIKALLDPAEIQQAPNAKKAINAPPRFDMPLDVDKIKLPPPGRTPGRGSTRLRSASPSKIASPIKSKASPRKRQTKAQKEAALEHANAASASLQSALDDVVSTTGAESVSTDQQPQETPATSPSIGGESVKVEVEQDVEVSGNTEVTHTNVTVEMPAGSPQLPLPQDTEAMLETAKRMVEEAKQLEGSPKISRNKRKLDEVDPSDLDGELPQQPAKKARVLEESLKREKVRNRAMFGVAASLAVA
jgi:hypothetical protein